MRSGMPKGSDWRGTSKQFNKDDITTYNISCFLLPIYDIQMLIKSVVWQELSSHHGVLQCQMADVQKRLRALQSYQGYFSMRKQSANNVGSKHRLKMRMLI
uniref:Uncharacterized protein n=1 Tax=Oryza glumipatula TaxID=40148 RepID=A0A0E0A1C6_9ORYZ